MRLILVRHGDAGDPDPGRWPDDRRRPLTAEGIARHRQVSLGLRRMGVVFDAILASPLLRARQTAEITAEVYGWQRGIEEAEALGDRAAPDEILGPLRSRDPGSAVLCVGHEPNLSRLAALLVSADRSARIQVRKSGVLAIDFDGLPAPARGRLRFHLGPEDLLSVLGAP